MLIVINASIDAWFAAERIVMLKAVWPLGVAIEKHHPNKLGNELCSLLLQKWVLKSYGGAGKGFRDVTVGHRPDPSVPGTIHPLAFPFRHCAEEFVIYAGGRDRIGRPEFSWIQQMALQSRKMRLIDNVGEVRIEARRCLHHCPFASGRINVKKQLFVRIPHFLQNGILDLLRFDVPQFRVIRSAQLFCNDAESAFQLIDVNRDINSLQPKHLAPIVLICPGIDRGIAVHILLPGLVVIVDVVHSADLFVPLTVKVRHILLQPIVHTLQVLLGWMEEVQLQQGIAPIGVIEHLLPVVVHVDIAAESAVFPLIVDENEEAPLCKLRLVMPPVLKHVTLSAVRNWRSKVTDSLAYERPLVVPLAAEHGVEPQTIPAVPIVARQELIRAREAGNGSKMIFPSDSAQLYRVCPLDDGVELSFRLFECRRGSKRYGHGVFGERLQHHLNMESQVHETFVRYSSKLCFIRKCAARELFIPRGERPVRLKRRALAEIDAV